MTRYQCWPGIYTAHRRNDRMITTPVTRNGWSAASQIDSTSGDYWLQGDSSELKSKIVYPCFQISFEMEESISMNMSLDRYVLEP